ncbi:MAG: hypothetical protein P9F19_15890 [Candidatus Contendobacter sp.]|nr:hypothetical protein [Candidatus Contendobacter sp.]MDG4558853.1 hypothetical protein [Candidatus Contendobacter sp.]
MKSTDKPAFSALLNRYMTEVYDKALSVALLRIWWSAMQHYELANIETAFERYITDPKDCRFAPKPGDIVKHIEAARADDGHPGPDEAWGMLLRLIGDERETGVLTDEMRAGWAACQPILDLGDEVGARRCFIEVYARHVEDARRNGQPARWTATLGVDPQLRIQRLQEAVQANRLSRDQITALLPGPTPASLDQVAGLLEGPDAPRPVIDAAERLRALAAMLRANSAEAEARRAEQHQRDREAEQAKRQALLDQIAARAQDRRDAA